MLYVRVQRKLEPRSDLYRLWVWLQFIDKHHSPHMESPRPGTLWIVAGLPEGARQMMMEFYKLVEKT